MSFLGTLSNAELEIHAFGAYLEAQNAPDISLDPIDTHIHKTAFGACINTIRAAVPSASEREIFFTISELYPRNTRFIGVYYDIGSTPTIVSLIRKMDLTQEEFEVLAERFVRTRLQTLTEPSNDPKEWSLDPMLPNLFLATYIQYRAAANPDNAEKLIDMINIGQYENMEELKEEFIRRGYADKRNTYFTRVCAASLVKDFPREAAVLYSIAMKDADLFDDLWLFHLDIAALQDLRQQPELIPVLNDIIRLTSETLKEADPKYTAFYVQMLLDHDNYTGLKEMIGDGIVSCNYLNRIAPTDYTIKAVCREVTQQSREIFAEKPKREFPPSVRRSVRF
jgi:hypothetical protein